MGEINGLPLDKMVREAHAALERYGVSDAGDLACAVLALAQELEVVRTENARRLRDCGNLNAMWQRDKDQLRRLESGLLRLAARCGNYSPADMRANIADMLGLEVAELAEP